MQPFLPASVVVLGALVSAPAPAWAQIPVAVHGRVEDAVTERPIAGARIFTGDASAIVFADSLGAFTLPLESGTSTSVIAEQYGYFPLTFALGPESASKVSVLRLEPAPIELEGVTVVEESALSSFLTVLDRRGRSYSGAVTTFDRPRIEGMGGVTAYDLVRRGMPFARPCGDFRDQLCVRARGVLGSVLVCIDDWRSIDPVGELQALSIESVARAEFYGPTSSVGLSARSPRLSAGGPGGRAPDAVDAAFTVAPLNGQIRIYTPQWIVSRASRGTRALFPVSFGC